MSFDLAAAERAARDALRMPAGHPESLTAELPGADEEMLAELCTVLWPADEYAEITAGDGSMP